MPRRDGASLVPLTSQGPRRGGVSIAETPLDPPASPQLAAPPVPGFARDAEEGIQEGAGGRGGGPAWAARALHLLSPNPAAGGGAFCSSPSAPFGVGAAKPWGGGGAGEEGAERRGRPRVGGAWGGGRQLQSGASRRGCACACVRVHVCREAPALPGHIWKPGSCGEEEEEESSGAAGLRAAGQPGEGCCGGRGGGTGRGGHKKGRG